eukprot:364054-Chlamydomonas_euryale.AAC.11
MSGTRQVCGTSERGRRRDGGVDRASSQGFVALGLHWLVVLRGAHARLCGRGPSANAAPAGAAKTLHRSATARCQVCERAETTERTRSQADAIHLLPPCAPGPAAASALAPAPLRRRLLVSREVGNKIEDGNSTHGCSRGTRAGDVPCRSARATASVAAACVSLRRPRWLSGAVTRANP